MSFLLLRGEKFCCTSCDKVITLEFKDGAKYTQIGDENVFIQKEMNNRLMPNTYDANREGYYFFDNVICEECLMKYKNKQMKIFSDAENDPCDKLYSYENLYTDEIEKTRKSIISEFTRQFDEEYCKTFDSLVFERTIGLKKFKLTCYKEKLAREYVEGCKKKIKPSVIAFIKDSELVEEIERNYQREIQKFKEETCDLLTYSINSYVNKIDLDKPVNLNPYLCAETTTREFIIPNENICIFQGPYEYPVQELKKFVNSDLKGKIIKPDQYIMENVYDQMVKRIAFG